jgi:hypothetical protein
MSPRTWALSSLPPGVRRRLRRAQLWPTVTPPDPRSAPRSLQRAILPHRVLPRGGHRALSRRRQYGRFRALAPGLPRGCIGGRFLARERRELGWCLRDVVEAARRGAAEEVRTNSLGREASLSTSVSSAGFDLSLDFDDCGVGLEVGADLDEAGSEGVAPAPFLCCARTVAREDCTAERTRGRMSVSIRLKYIEKVKSAFVHPAYPAFGRRMHKRTRTC